MLSCATGFSWITGLGGSMLFGVCGLQAKTQASKQPSKQTNQLKPDTSAKRTNKQTYMQSNKQTNTHTSTQAHTHTHTTACTRTERHTCINTKQPTSKHVLINEQIHTYSDTYVHLYTHAHTHTSRLSLSYACTSQGQSCLVPRILRVWGSKSGCERISLELKLKVWRLSAEGLSLV